MYSETKDHAMCILQNMQYFLHVLCNCNKIVDQVFVPIFDYSAKFLANSPPPSVNKWGWNTMYNGTQCRSACLLRPLHADARLLPAWLLSLSWAFWLRSMPVLGRYLRQWFCREILTNYLLWISFQWICHEFGAPTIICSYIMRIHDSDT